MGVSSGVDQKQKNVLQLFLDAVFLFLNCVRWIHFILLILIDISRKKRAISKQFSYFNFEISNFHHPGKKSPQTTQKYRSQCSWFCDKSRGVVPCFSSICFFYWLDTDKFLVLFRKLFKYKSNGEIN